VNVRDLLGRAELGLSVIAAEAEALDAPARNGYITDLPEPARFLADGDVVLTSGLWLALPDGADRFVRSVAASGASAVVLGTLEIGVVPTEVIALCRELGVTLLTIAGGVSFRDVVSAVADAQPGSAAGLASRSAAFRRRLSAALSHGDGLAALLELGEEALGAPCWAVDERGETVGGSEPSAAATGSLWNDVIVHGHERAAAAGPATGIRIGDDPAIGVLCVARDGGPLDDATALELDALLGAMRVEMELGLRWRRARGAQAGELIRQIASHEASPGIISARLRLEGLDPQAQTVTIAARCDDPRFPPAAVSALLIRSAESAGLAVLAAERDGASLLLVNGESTDAWFASLSELPDAAGDAALADRRLLIGVGDAISGVSRLGSSLQTALARLDAVPERDARVLVATAVHVGGYRALLGLLGDGTRRGFAEEVLSPILEYDRRHDADLIATLRAFLDGDGAWQETARALHLHPNTLRYRMARIRELTGRDVARLADRVDLFLALACLDDGDQAARRGTGTPIDEA